MRGAGSRHWSLGASSSREPKADGGSLKCSHLRRQRQGGFWCILAGPGGVDGSRNLSPKLSHQHVLAKWQEWLSARGHVWEGCSVHSLPHYMGFQIFTYVTISDIYICNYIYWDVRRETDHHFPWDFQKQLLLRFWLLG